MFSIKVLAFNIWVQHFRLTCYIKKKKKCCMLHFWTGVLVFIAENISGLFKPFFFFIELSCAVECMRNIKYDRRLPYGMAQYSCPSGHHLPPELPHGLDGNNIMPSRNGHLQGKSGDWIVTALSFDPCLCPASQKEKSFQVPSLAPGPFLTQRLSSPPVAGECRGWASDHAPPFPAPTKDSDGSCPRRC